MFLPHLPCPKCVPPSFQSVLVITADFGRADTSKSSQVVVSGPDRAAGHQEAPGLPSKDPNLQNAHLRGGRLAKPQFPFVSVEALRGVCTSWGPARTNHTSQPRRHFSLSLTDVCNMVAHIVEIIIVLRELHSHTLSGAE